MLVVWSVCQDRQRCCIIDGLAVMESESVVERGRAIYVCPSNLTRRLDFSK